MEKSQEMIRAIFRGKLRLVGGLLAFLTLFTVTGVAAPAGKARVNRTVFDPVASKPVWVSSTTTTRPDPMLIDVMQGLKVTAANGDDPLVVVPARPTPRSPFMPPSQISINDLPPWVLAGQS